MRVMVDMSATLLHHGHVRLLRQAKELGDVVVGLTSDAEVEVRKGYVPELSFDERKELLLALRYVDEVVETPWLITEDVLREHSVDLLLHGADNSNPISSDKLRMLPRTAGVSSSELRERAVAAIVQGKNKKALFTPGPASLLPDNLLPIEPCFGRGDAGYAEVEARVLARLRTMTGHAHIARLQGSATLAIEIVANNFLRGRSLVVTTGYYGERLAAICRSAATSGSTVEQVTVDQVQDVGGRYDWLVTVYTETSTGFRNDIREMRRLADRLGAKLFVDATGSVGLEDHHDVADVVAYSSCKGLFGLTGAAFVAYNEPPQNKPASFNLDLNTHVGRKTTGPYHAIYSLDRTVTRQAELREAVQIGKEVFCRKYADLLLRPEEHQPLLCTLIGGVLTADDASVLYEPRSAVPGTSVVCHLGEVHLGAAATGTIYDRLTLAVDLASTRG